MIFNFVLQKVEHRTASLHSFYFFIQRKFCSIAEDEENILKTYKPTHVVTAITYGADAHIVFQKVILFTFLQLFIKYF